jgi:hypothetical protein
MKTIPDQIADVLVRPRDDGRDQRVPSCAYGVFGCSRQNALSFERVFEGELSSRELEDDAAQEGGVSRIDLYLHWRCELGSAVRANAFGTAFNGVQFRRHDLMSTKVACPNFDRPASISGPDLPVPLGALDLERTLN